MGLATLFVAELVWLSVNFDGPDLAGRTGPVVAVLTSTDALLQFGIGVMALGALYLVSRDRVVGPSLAYQPGYRWQPWLGVHAVAIVLFALLTALVFTGAPVASISVLWFTAWLTCGITTVIFLLVAAVPARLWIGLLAREYRGLAVCGLAGVAVWLGGQLARSFWRPLASMTLKVAYGLLAMVYPDAYYTSDGVLGTGSFSVEIAPQCSGYEGIWLVTAFGASYLWLFRRELSFPRALVLIPIGVVAMQFANTIRVAALVGVGTSLSPALAIHGFHSQAGWIGFTLIALGLIAISHRLFRTVNTPPAGLESRPASRLATALVAPFLALTAAAMLSAAFSAGFNALYPLGVIVTAAVLWGFRRHYCDSIGRPTWDAIAIGIVVFAVWTWLEPEGTAQSNAMPTELGRWPAGLAGLWLLFRIAGSVITVPIAEELAFRGYLLRRLAARDFETAAPGRFSWLALGGSSLAFGLLHERWLAGTAAGIGFACAVYRRGRTGDAIVAHITTNALIAALVLWQGRWGLWT